MGAVLMQLIAAVLGDTCECSSLLHTPSLLQHSSHMEGLVPTCEGQISGGLRLARGVQPARLCSRVSAQAGPMQACTVSKAVYLEEGQECLRHLWAFLSRQHACWPAAHQP